MGETQGIQKGLKISIIKWTKQKWMAFGVSIFFGKEFDTRFIRILVNFIWGIKIEIGW
jgi:hypothetical protein